MKIKKGMNAIVECLYYHKSVTQLRGPNGDKTWKQQSKIGMRHLPVVSIYIYLRELFFARIKNQGIFIFIGYFLLERWKKTNCVLQNWLAWNLGLRLRIYC